MKVVAEPLASQHLVDTEARVSVSEWQEVVPAESRQGQNHCTSNPCAHHAVTREPLAGGDVLPRPSFLAALTGVCRFFSGIGVEDKLNQCSRYERRSKMSREIMMQEQLTTHYVEGEIMGGPRQEEETGRVVKT